VDGDFVMAPAAADGQVYDRLINDLDASAEVEAIAQASTGAAHHMVQPQ
jgi:hypothetical protein